MKFQIEAAKRLAATNEMTAADAKLKAEFKKVVEALQKTSALHHANPSINKPSVVQWFYKGDEDTYQVNIIHGDISFIATFLYQEDMAAVEFVATGKSANELFKNIKRKIPEFLRNHTDEPDSDDPVSDDSLEELKSIASELR